MLWLVFLLPVLVSLQGSALKVNVFSPSPRRHVIKLCFVLTAAKNTLEVCHIVPAALPLGAINKGSGGVLMMNFVPLTWSEVKYSRGCRRTRPQTASCYRLIGSGEDFFFYCFWETDGLAGRLSQEILREKETRVTAENNHIWLVWPRLFKQQSPLGGSYKEARVEPESLKITAAKR